MKFARTKTSSLTQMDRRSYLENASAIPLLTSMLERATQAARSGAELSVPVLAPHYIYGLLVQNAGDRLELHAPTRNGFESVTLHAPGGIRVVAVQTDLAVKDIEVGSRIEAGTVLAGENLLERFALWVNVNSICSHGYVTESSRDEGVITLRQAHNGPLRRIHIKASTKCLTEGGTAGSDALFSSLTNNDHVFWTGVAESAELGCADVHAVTCHRVGAGSEN